MAGALPLIHIVLVLALSVLIHAQDFLTAISQYPTLSNFTTLFYDNPGLANAVLTSKYSSDFQQTVLVPNNDAFTKLETKLGAPVDSLTVEQLEPILSYLVLVGSLTTVNFTAPQGTTVPTFLTGPQFNNRTAGPALGVASGNSSDPRNGQVVFIKAANDTATSRRFTVRQGGSGQTPGEIVQAGLGHKVNMTAIDGYWDGGRFQIVDAFLDLPINCTATFNAWKVFTFLSYMVRTGLGPIVDTTQNVTCLTPPDTAFLTAGTSSDNVTALGDLALRHVLKEPVYTSFLQDGDEFETLNGETVRVSMLNGQIYFNDALLTKPNVFTNNGVMHVIDRVMAPLSSTGSSSPTSTSSSSSSTGPATVTVTTSATPKNGAGSAGNGLQQAGWMASWLSILGCCSCRRK